MSSQGCEHNPAWAKSGDHTMDILCTRQPVRSEPKSFNGLHGCGMLLVANSSKCQWPADANLCQLAIIFPPLQILAFGCDSEIFDMQPRVTCDRSSSSQPLHAQVNGQPMEATSLRPTRRRKRLRDM